MNVKRKTCKCGCGEFAKLGNRFIYGHQCRGKKHSPKTLKKMSGRVVTKEMKEKISKGMMGKNKGKSHPVTEEARKKIADTLRKNDSEFGKYWNEYHSCIEHYQYRRLREKVGKRDHYRCVQCNKKNKMLNIHHIVPVRIGYRSRLCDHESNMVTFCISCHGKLEAGGKDKWKEFLSAAKKYLSQFGYEEMLLDKYLILGVKLIRC